jgi:signal transduction histidine kinase
VTAAVQITSDDSIRFPSRDPRHVLRELLGIAPFSGLTGDAWFLFVTLALYIGDHDDGWPTRETLGTFMDRGDTTLRKATKELVAAGIIRTRLVRQSGRRDRTSIRYAFGVVAGFAFRAIEARFPRDAGRPLPSRGAGSPPSPRADKLLGNEENLLSARARPPELVPTAPPEPPNKKVISIQARNPEATHLPQERGAVTTRPADPSEALARCVLDDFRDAIGLPSRGLHPAGDVSMVRERLDEIPSRLDPRVEATAAIRGGIAASEGSPRLGFIFGTEGRFGANRRRGWALLDDEARERRRIASEAEDRRRRAAERAAPKLTDEERARIARESYASLYGEPEPPPAVPAPVVGGVDPVVLAELRALLPPGHPTLSAYV